VDELQLDPVGVVDEDRVVAEVVKTQRVAVRCVGARGGVALPQPDRAVAVVTVQVDDALTPLADDVAGPDIAEGPCARLSIVLGSLTEARAEVSRPSSVRKAPDCGPKRWSGSDRRSSC
jgi:hypothetical protein